MTLLDDIHGDLAAGVAAMSTRAISVLFAASAEALLPEFRRWADHTHDPSEPLLERGLEAAYEIAHTGQTTADLADLLRAFDAGAPPGESPDHFSSTFAQDCWICADMALRVHLGSSDAPGPVIWYALEPILQSTTQRLFGVSSIGSGSDEPAQEAVLLRDVRMLDAIEFVRTAIRLLSREAEPDLATIAEVRRRAAVLLP